MDVQSSKMALQALSSVGYGAQGTEEGKFILQHSSLLVFAVAGPDSSPTW